MSAAPRVEALLRAGRAEEPPAGNAERMIAGLGLGAGATSGIGVAGRAARTWLRGIGLGLVWLGIAWTRARAIPVNGAPGVDETAPLRSARIDREDPPCPAPVRLEARSSVEPAAPPFPAFRLPRHPPATATPAATCLSAPSGEELAPVSDARLALRRGDAAAALSRLADHARAFPHGDFLEEAAALRVEALALAGRFDEARRMADAFDQAYPHSPYGPPVDAVRRNMKGR